MPCAICGEVVRRSRGEQGGLGGGEPEHLPNEIRHTPIKCLSGEGRIGEECDCVCSVKKLYSLVEKALPNTYCPRYVKWQFQFIVCHLPSGHGHVQWVNLSIFCQFKLGYWLMNLAISGVRYYLVSPV